MLNISNIYKRREILGTDNTFCEHPKATLQYLIPKMFTISGYRPVASVTLVSWILLNHKNFTRFGNSLSRLVLVAFDHVPLGKTLGSTISRWMFCCLLSSGDKAAPTVSPAWRYLAPVQDCLLRLSSEELCFRPALPSDV